MAEHLLPEDFRESLSLIPKDQSVSLFTRHSIREEAENYNAHYNLPLTEDGIALAAYWGALQPFKDFRLFSSPIGRCVETARHMHSGKSEGEEKAEVEIVAGLAEPGCFIKDREVMKEVGKVFVDEGPITFINHMVSGKFDHVISTKESITGLIRQFREKDNQKKESLSVHVSHDTILAAFVYGLVGKSELVEEDWPRMMEGVYLWFDDRKLYGIWRGERFDVSLSQFN